jgi:NTE family protein
MRGLVLSGGGAKGAYQAGVLEYLLGVEGRSYDILCGISVGALNAGCLAQFKKGEEKAADKELVALWRSINTAKVYKKWPIVGELAALWKSSVYDSTPLQQFVRARLDPVKLKSSGKKLRVGAVSLNTGEYQLFGEDHPSIVEAVLASSAFPGMLSPVSLDGQVWTDGGVREVTPLRAALDLGATEVDIIVCAPENASYKFPKNLTTLKVAERSIDLMSDEITSNDLKIASMYNRLVRAGLAKPKREVKLRVFRPKEVLLENSLDFEPAGIKAMLLKGFQDARDHVVAGE